MVHSLASRTRWREEALELSMTANAYLGCAQRLCEMLIQDGDAKSVYDNRVVLHLTALAVELSFKAGIAAFSPPYPKHHDLARLQSAYSDAGVTPTLALPGFIVVLIGSNQNHLEGFKPPNIGVELERLRYCSDRSDRPFPRPRMVDLEELSEELQELQKSSFSLFLEIRRTVSS